jgi:hypothetical protein
VNSWINCKVVIFLGRMTRLFGLWKWMGCSPQNLCIDIAFGGVVSRRMKEVWLTRVPLKVRIFMWQMFHDRLQSAEQLKKRNWKGEISCPLCGVVEDVNHIMFRCVCNRFAWAVVKEALGWKQLPSSLEEFTQGWLDGSFKANNRIILFCLGAMCWSLWKVRNKMVIEKKLIASPQVVIYSAIPLMQQWRPLLAAKERGLIQIVCKKVKRVVDKVARSKSSQPRCGVS